MCISAALADAICSSICTPRCKVQCLMQCPLILHEAAACWILANSVAATHSVSVHERPLHCYGNITAFSIASLLHDHIHPGLVPMS